MLVDKLVFDRLLVDMLLGGIVSVDMSLDIEFLLGIAAC